MKKRRSQTEAMKQCLKAAQCCDLCGSTSRTLEAHHIIPVVCGGSDSADNLVAICARCHAILTPKSVLCKIGIEQAKHKNALSVRFYTKIGERLDEIADKTFGYLDAEDIMDIFDEVIHEEEKSIKNSA